MKPCLNSTWTSLKGLFPTCLRRHAAFQACMIHVVCKGFKMYVYSPHSGQTVPSISYTWSRSIVQSSFCSRVLRHYMHQYFLYLSFFVFLDIYSFGRYVFYRFFYALHSFQKWYFDVSLVASLLINVWALNYVVLDFSKPPSNYPFDVVCVTIFAVLY